MIRMLLPGSLLVLMFCGIAMDVPAQTDLPRGALEQAESDATVAITQIPAYTADPLSRFEGPEIAAVQRDITTLREAGDDAAFVREAAILEQDWKSLVGLDELLQRESAI